MKNTEIPLTTSSGQTYRIRETFPHLGKVLHLLIPDARTPVLLHRQQQVMTFFQAALNHYEKAYLSYQRVKTDRAREIVGLPFFVDLHGEERVLEATGWEGYFVGCRRSDGIAMTPVDVMQAIAEHGQKLFHEIRARGATNYDTSRNKPVISTLLQILEGEAYDDVEALKEVNELYGAMLGHLRAALYQHRTDGPDGSTRQSLIARYLATGSLPVSIDGDFGRDVQQYAHFRDATLASLAFAPAMTYQLEGDTLLTTCTLPLPARSLPDGSAFSRVRISFTPEEHQGYHCAVSIGRLGNPVVRALLSLLG